MLTAWNFSDLIPLLKLTTCGNPFGLSPVSHTFCDTGAQDEGVKGFFKGLGRGLMGFFIKPAGGTVDMVALVMDGISRSVEYLIY